MSKKAALNRKQNPIAETVPMHETVENQSQLDESGLKDDDLVYAATSRCFCGAGLAHRKDTDTSSGFWECSDLLTGRAKPTPNGFGHVSGLSFIHYHILPETSASASGLTTRPK